MERAACRRVPRKSKRGPVSGHTPRPSPAPRSEDGHGQGRTWKGLVPYSGSRRRHVRHGSLVQTVRALQRRAKLLRHSSSPWQISRSDAAHDRGRRRFASLASHCAPSCAWGRRVKHLPRETPTDETSHLAKLTNVAPETQPAAVWPSKLQVPDSRVPCGTTAKRSGRLRQRGARDYVQKRWHQPLRGGHRLSPKDVVGTYHTGGRDRFAARLGGYVDFHQARRARAGPSGTT
jgi:hypothetical protein